jgi:hypothetical protein
MSRPKKLKPLLAIHYSCICCGISFLDEKLSYPRSGCDRGGSSLVAIELREEESLKVAKINVGVGTAFLTVYYSRYR